MPEYTVVKRVHIVPDTKARRVLNTAPTKIMNITPVELTGQGLTIERMENLNVPAYYYATQLTIHGKIKGEIPYGVGGYKNLIRNQNGSLGVKYSAIDMKKKRLIEKVAQFAKSGWHVNITSSACEVYKIFYNDDTDLEGTDIKDQVTSCYDGIPSKLFTGQKFIGRLMWGAGFYVAMEIGTIYEKNVWKYCKQVFGMNEKEFELAKIARKKQREQEEREAEVAQAKRVAETEARRVRRFQELLDAGFKDAQVIKEGFYARPHANHDDKWIVTHIRKNKRGLWEKRSIVVGSIAEIKPFEVNFRKAGALVNMNDNYPMAKYVKVDAQKIVEVQGGGGIEWKRLLTFEYERDWTWFTFPIAPPADVQARMKTFRGWASKKHEGKWFFKYQLTEDRIQEIINGG